ncbi:hypothetical protein FTO68_02530 [Methanocalculus taiwanensis]|uniref:Uncharacterized protein n=1 Tax=Methanocalculus taiwanensis TaxID=106207 RepID=A0ABD4TI41_9EURY|nr:hypothetical protein [Methanocalculus taiwanensis]MCQ1537864.1 hypothetical protein [Methanocalculus taiwanensis]
MDEWAKTWLRREREKGAKCLEIKYISGKPYVYHSTSRYDKTTKSPRKVSTYLGRLTEDQGLIPKGTRKNRETETVTWIVEPPEAPETREEIFEDSLPLPAEGASLLHHIREAFPDCHHEFTRLLIQRSGLNPPPSVVPGTESMEIPGPPDLAPERLLPVLSGIGSNTSGQQMIASALKSDLRRIAYPFTLAGKEPDPNRMQSALLVIGADSGIPVMIQRLSDLNPATIASTVLSMETPAECPGELILFINPEEISKAGGREATGEEPDCSPLQEAKLSYIFPLPHESSRYDIPLYLTGHFTYNDRLILYGTDESAGVVTYLFKDIRSAGREAEEIDSLADQKPIDRPTRKHLLKRAGRRIILSSLRRRPKEIYHLASSAEQMHPAIAMIREMVEMDLAMAGTRGVDDDAITGSLVLNLLVAHISMKDRDRGGKQSVPFTEEFIG